MTNDNVPRYCPDCRNDELELIDGDFGTGVFAPDGTEQVGHETGYLCQVCQYIWSLEDLEVWRLIEKDINDMQQIPDLEPEVDALERWLS